MDRINHLKKNLVEFLHKKSAFTDLLQKAEAKTKVDRLYLVLETHRKDDDTKWLTYWVVFGLIGVVESFTDLFLYWIPLYSLLKCILFLCLMVPTTPNGSIIIYNKLIRPYFLAYQNKIDSALDKAADLAGDFGNAARKKATDVIADQMKSD